MITIKPRPSQQECLDLINANPTGRYIIAAHVGYGKRQPYSSLILTPSGYVKMGDLKIGDIVYDGYGEETNVTGIYEQGIQDVYKVTFSDDSVCECGLEHLWKVKTHRSKNWKVITLEEIMDKGLYLLNGSKGIQLEGKEGKYAYRYEIPLASINHKPKDFDIHPYLMGVLLGDGCFTEKQPNCQISCPDSAYDIIENVEKVLPQGYYLRKNRYNSCPHYIISSGKINKSFLHYIDDLGLRKYSKDKFIPNAYFQGSREQRKELLSGLLDTDGSVGVRNQITFHTTSKQLALDVIKLIQSLGGIGKLRIYDRIDENKPIEYQVNVSVNFNPFKTSIKASKVTERVKFTPKRKMKSIEKVRQEQSRCIMVDSPDHTYITNDYIVTHNTFIMSRIKKLGRVLILSHREELVYQPLKYMSGTTGVEKGKEKSNHTEDVVSASVQTLSRRLDEYDPYEFDEIYYDECHHAAAPENRKILNHFKPKRIIGFSATPSRNDNIRLDDIFDKVLYEYDIRQGIENGYLAPIKVLSVKMDYDLANVKMQRGDLAPTGLAEAMKDTAPSIAEAYYKYARGSTLIFCASVELAYKVAELIKGAEVIEGKTPPDKRREILEKFSSGEIKVVCNNLVLTEGYDNPRIETVIMARPTTNTNLVVQCLDYETEILTKEGWKSYGNIATGDDVITYNIDKKVIELDKALEVFDREVADGESFIKIKSQLMDIRITDNHNVLFKGSKNSGDYSLKQATELLNYSDGVRIPVAGEMNFKGVDLTDEEIRMMGWALSDAHIRKNKAITITQSLDVNKPNCEEIESLLIRNNVKFIKTIKTNTTNFTNGKLRNQAIFYISNGNSNRLKNVPQQYFQNPKFNGILEKELSDEFLYNATKHQWKVFIDTFNKADGTKKTDYIDSRGKPYTRRTINIAKGNKKLLERIQIGCIIRGIRANIRKHENDKNKYIIKIKETDNVVVDAKHDGRAIFEVDKPKENERVWCIKTNNSTLITRRDGIVSITGNCVGRGARLFEGKKNCLVIDCVSATRDGLASPTSLLGYDMPLAALKRMKEEEIDLFDIPEIAEELADVPETWIKGVKEVDIWAKKNKIKLYDMNLRKRGDGSLVIGLPNNIFYEVPPIDVLGKIEIQGQKVKAQEVIDSLFTRLMTHHRPEMPIWSKRSSKRWGSKPLTQKQYDMIRHLKNVDLSGVEITKLTSMEASIIIGESKLRRRK